MDDRITRIEDLVKKDDFLDLEVGIYYILITKKFTCLILLKKETPNFIKYFNENNKNTYNMNKREMLSLRPATSEEINKEVSK